MALGLTSSVGNAATVRYDFNSSEPSGFFVVDTWTGIVSDWHITSGPVLGGGDFTHYAGPGYSPPYSFGTATFNCQSRCIAQFTTEGSGASFGQIDLILTWMVGLENGDVNILEEHSGATATTGRFQQSRYYFADRP